MQRFKQRKLLFNAVLTILSISVINFSQCPSGNLCTNAQWPHFHWDLIIAWTWTNRGSIGNAFGVPTSHQKSFSLPDERWTLSMDLITYFMMDVRMTHTTCLFVTCQKLSNVFIDITENGFVWTRSICHNLKHPTGSRRSYIFVTDCVVSIYWPISKRHHHVLVFSFREGCHPMVDTQPPKTF